MLKTNVKSVTLFQNADGKRIHIVYSESDEKGRLMSDNITEDRLIVDEDAEESFNNLFAFALDLLNDEE